MSATNCIIKGMIGILMLLFVQVGWGQTMVSVLPATREISPGETLTLSVCIATTDSLHAYQVCVRFDNSILQFTDVAEGPYLQTGPFGTFFHNYPAPGPGTDSVTVTQAILGPDAISGTGVLFSITFTAVGIGVTPIAPDDVTLFRGDGISTFTASVQSSQVAVGVPLPVQLASFVGDVQAPDKVRLKWATLSEVNNYGFFVERQGEEERGYQELPRGFVPGHGTTVLPRCYTYTDEGLKPGKWCYRLKQLDLDGAIHYSWTVEVQMSRGVDLGGVVTKYSLMQNYPNPFNPRTTIAFALPAAGNVSLEVFNLLGEHVVTLVSGPLDGGRHTVAWDASSAPSGVYLCRLAADNYVQTKKLIVAK
ncbi:MAG: T9SS type A sorting domain-containing protein [Bacteroidota bacterium]